MTEKVELTSARATLGRLADRAGGGETIELTRRGKTVALLIPPETFPRMAGGEMQRVDPQMAPRNDAAGDLLRHGREVLGGVAQIEKTALPSTQADVVDASHPSRRPERSNDAVRAQARRDDLLRGIGKTKR